MLWYDSPHTAYCNVNTLRPRQNGHHFADDIFKCVLLNENVWITIKNSLKFVPKGLINNIPALVQIMAWRRPGGKPLSEPMLISLPTHICVTRPRWVNNNLPPHLYCWSLTDILKLLLVVWKYLNLVHVSNDVCSFISSLISWEYYVLEMSYIIQLAYDIAVLVVNYGIWHNCVGDTIVHYQDRDMWKANRTIANFDALQQCWKITHNHTNNRFKLLYIWPFVKPDYICHIITNDPVLESLNLPRLS